MLKIIQSKEITCFIADIFMCEKRHTANDLRYWNLRLITNGNLIDAFHWEDPKHQLEYKNRDGLQVFGRWTNQRKDRVQILRSRLITTCAANDDVYRQDDQIQLEMDFGDEFKMDMGG